MYVDFVAIAGAVLKCAELTLKVMIHPIGTLKYHRSLLNQWGHPDACMCYTNGCWT